MSMMEQFADPQMIHSLSLGEKLMGSGITTLMGMGITFIVLFFLWGCIALMARIMNRGASRQESAPEPIISGPPVPAIVTAAVAEYENSGSGLVIRKIRRMPAKPVWSVTERKVSK